MPPEATLRAGGGFTGTGLGLPADWRRPLGALAMAWLAIGVLFAADWRDMAWQWWDSSTYNHILLVPPIIGWMVWQRREGLARLSPVAWQPGVALFALAAFLWVLGAFAGLSIARQAGAVAMLGASALALLGPRVGAGLAFPLCYTALLVPAGEELIPPLQMITAGLTIALVRLSGIPSVIDGVFIDTPAGLFEVAEACSGVKFLIAMIAFGLLVANACFVSWRRRMAFMAFCVAVPVLANGVRAFATILAAQYVGAKAATGFDHIVYGWVFFALVIALVVAVSWRFFDRPADDPMIDGEALAASSFLGRLERLSLKPALALALMAALAGGAQGWARAADGMEAALPAQVFLPQVPGWQRVDYAPAVWWQPRASGASHRLLGRYADAQGREVDVFAAFYPAQREGMEAGGFGEGALMPDSAWSWQSPGPSAGIAKSERLLANGRVGRIVQTYYRTGGLITGSNSRLKLANMADRLLLRERPTVLLILSAEEREGSDAAAALDAFRAATGPLDAWIDGMAGQRRE